MKNFFFTRLAVSGMKNNKELFIPYILANTGMIALYYIMNFIKYGGGANVRQIMNIGSPVVALFVFLFLIYTNSFMLKRRKKELGLYSVLGMSKKNLASLTIVERIIYYLISFPLGIVIGVGFSKIAELVLIKIIDGIVVYKLRFSASSFYETLLVFTFTSLVVLVISLISIWNTSPIKMLSSQSLGEKPIRANWLLALIGFVTLGVAYYLAMTLSNPMDAFSKFLITIVLVIIGTFIIFTSGSVALCKILKNSKGYYYKPNHFISVSSMTHRMKRNGMGLASICVMATMVLVMISTTSTIKLNSENLLENMAQREVNFTFTNQSEAFSQDDRSNIIRQIDENLKGGERVKKNVLDYQYYYGLAFVEGNEIKSFDGVGNSLSSTQLAVIGKDEYERLIGKKISLGKDNILILQMRTDEIDEKRAVKIGENEYRVAGIPSNKIAKGHIFADIRPVVFIVAENPKELFYGFKGVSQDSNETNSDDLGKKIGFTYWVYSFDVDHDSTIGHEVNASSKEGNKSEVESKYQSDNGREDLFKKTWDDVHINGNYTFFECNLRSETKAFFAETVGALLYLGIMMSMIFIFATVIIIYFKQLGEGYEDGKRFNIMKKVGLSKSEIKKSINSQIMTVFALPIVVAAVHVAAGFRLFYTLMGLFNVFDSTLFLKVSIACVLVFAAIYAVVYKITSRVYFNIVNGYSR